MSNVKDLHSKAGLLPHKPIKCYNVFT